MNLKKLGIIGLAAFMMLAVSCNKAETTSTKDRAPKQGGVVTFQAGADPKVLNPMYGNDRVTMTINNVIYSPLFYTYEGKREFVLAESLTPSKDFKTYTLKLKEGLKWDDGKPLTIDDMVFTLDKVMDETQKSMLRGNFMVDGKPVEYKKTGDLEMEFKLSKVSTSFEASLDDFAPIPKHIFEGEKDIAKSDKNLSPVGSGAFKMKEYKKGESVTLVRNDFYVGGKAKLDSIVYRIVGDPNSANTAFMNGEISAKYISPRDIDTFKDKANIEVFDEGMLINFIFNLRNENLAKPEVRQAIAYALNKEELVKAAYLDEKYATKAYSMLAPNAAGHVNDVEKYEQNIEKAKEIMKSSGVKNLTLKLLCVNGKKEDEAYTLVLQERLKEIGIKVEATPLERGAFIQKVFMDENKDFDIAINGYVMGSEPNQYRSIVETNGENNISKYSNKELDKLWDKANIETNTEKRMEIYKNIQSIVAKDMPIYPVAYTKSIVALNKNIGGAKEAKPAPIFMFRDVSKLYISE